jgi:Zn-dependent protease with chaperone function
MSLRLLLSSALAVAALAVPLSAAGECRNAFAGEASSYAPWGVPAKSIETLREVYRRLSAVTNTFPRLALCNSEEFYAAYFYGPRAVLLTTRVLTEFADRPSELAIVVGHEFAHGELAHGLRGAAARAEIEREEVRAAEEQLVAGGDYQLIVARARTEMKAYKAAVSRDLETEADERGLGIAVAAKFDAASAAPAFNRLAEIEGRVAFDLFSDHPDTQQRIADVEKLARNETYLTLAKSDLAASRPLGGTLVAWSKEVPGSGALAFYDAVERLRTKRRYAPEAFGDAVANFMGEGGISWVAQAHQDEAKAATLALCTSLYETGQSVTALHCIKRLSAEDRRKFDEWARPKSILITDRRRDERLPGLYSGRRAGSDAVSISNCTPEVERQDLRQVQLWRPSHVRQTVSKDDLESCDANLCNCERLDPAEAAEVERQIGIRRVRDSSIR